LEKATVFTGQTSKPRRCSGKTAAEFPTCPKATEDWTDKMFITLAVTMPIPGSGERVERL